MLTHFCINIVQFKVVSLQFPVVILDMIPGKIPCEILLTLGNVDNTPMVLCGLSKVIVKYGGRLLEQLVLMSSALRASTRSLGFLMGYKYI